MEMTITASDVNKLRKATGAGLMDCKKALVEAGGDFEAAIDYLRKKGQKVSAKRADREAKEGVVIATTTADYKKGYIVHVTSETDFVAKNIDFIQFAKNIAAVAMDTDTNSIEELYAQKFENSTVKDTFDQQVGRIGEKIEIGNYARIESESVVPYIHAGYKIGVLVGFNQPASDDLTSLGKDIAMQIAAMSPIAIDENDVEDSVKQRELEIGREQAKNEGKPEQIIEKIAQGKLQRFYKDNTLMHQQFVKDGSKKVAEVLKNFNKDLTVTAFKRVALGE
jgi:elongation factor Ts